MQRLKSKLKCPTFACCLYQVLTYMMSPNLRRVCMRAQVLWSEAASAARRRRGGIGEAGGEPSPTAATTRRTPGELPRRRTDACRPPTPPSILRTSNTSFKKMQTEKSTIGGSSCIKSPNFSIISTIHSKQALFKLNKINIKGNSVGYGKHQTKGELN